MMVSHLKLFVFVKGLGGCSFSVSIKRSETVHDLKRAILKETPNGLKGIDADELTLYKVELTDGKNLEQLAHQADKKVLEVPSLSLSEVFPTNIPKDKVSVLVEVLNIAHRKRSLLPAEEDRQAAKLRKLTRVPSDASEYVNVTAEILRYWRSEVKSIPSVGELKCFLDKPLEERAKIPLYQYQFDTLVSSSTWELNDITTKEDISKLFRIDDHEHAEPLHVAFTGGLMQSPPNHNASKKAFIGFWDNNIRCVMESLIPDGLSIRADYTSTKAQRPDFGFLYRNFCPFRGQEESPSDAENPRAELVKRMTWIYDPAPYVLGYYATGPMVSLVAICCPVAGSQEPEIVDIFHINLRTKVNRIINFIRLVRLCSLIVPITTVIGSRTTPEFIPIKKDDKTIEVCGTNIKKTYDGSQCLTSIPRLHSVYKILKAKGVPNVDHMAVSFNDKVHGTVAFLEPKGISVIPKTIQEVLDAIGCILDALTVMHQEPDCLFHRDIRWPNVIKSADDPRKWFLIDWDDAGKPPTLAANHLDPQNHAPAVFKDNHGSEVDVWGVGRLIKDSSRSIAGFPLELRKVGEAMQLGTLDVPGCIEKINALKAKFTDGP